MKSSRVESFGQDESLKRLPPDSDDRVRTSPGFSAVSVYEAEK